MTSTVMSVANSEKDDKITIRPVTTRDLFTVVRVIIPRLDMERVRNLFTNLPQSEKEREEYFKIAGMEMIMMVLSIAIEEDVQRWLADIAGMTYEVFLDSPIETPFKIVQAMGENAEIRKIFLTLLQ